MFENSEELAENKLLILYILNKIKFPIANNQLTEIILEENFLNYFTLQNYIQDLLSSGFICNVEDDNKKRLIISSKGIKVLDLFKDRINFRRLDAVDKFLENKVENIRKEIAVSAEYTIEAENSFVVNLKIYEAKTVLMDIKLNVPSNKEAREICNRWKTNSSTLYKNIVQALVE